MRKLILSLMLLPFASVAASSDVSGHILYVSGEVTVERAAKLYRAVPRAKLKQGDKIVTNSAGRAHIRMSDRTLLSLKPNTEFVIERYRFRDASGTATAVNQGRSSDASGSEPDVSVFGLLKGGFRAITGLIGQRDKGAFGVNTAVATIGIRGTSFVADLEPVVEGGAQQADTGMLQVASSGQFASDIPGGMYLAAADGRPPVESQRLVVGVGFGKVILTNSAGSVMLEHGEFGQVLGPALAPSRLARPQTDSEANLGGQGGSSDSEDDDQDRRMRMASRRLSQQGGAWAGRENDVQRPNQEAEVIVVRSEVTGPQRNLTIASSLTAFGDHTQALSASVDRLRGDDAGHLTGFVAGVDQADATVPAVYELTTGQVVNAGADPEVGLSWGRWSGETMSLRASDDRPDELDLETVGLHYLIGPVLGERFVFPVDGTREFVLVGNTDPTDSNGQIGFLGRAELSADFVNHSVQSSLSLSVSDQVWTAAGEGFLGQGLSEATPVNVFAGQYGVSLNGTAGGAGTFSGFMTQGAEAAGLGYALEHSGTLVRGVAAFAAQPAN